MNVDVRSALTRFGAENGEVSLISPMTNVIRILKPGGIAYVSFDGLEKEDEREFVVLGDGTREYVNGEREGMLWRFYTDEEIRVLSRSMRILEFAVKDSGKREVWLRRPKE